MNVMPSDNQNNTCETTCRGETTHLCTDHDSFHRTLKTRCYQVQELPLSRRERHTWLKVRDTNLLFLLADAPAAWTHATHTTIHDSLRRSWKPQWLSKLRVLGIQVNRWCFQIFSNMKVIITWGKWAYAVWAGSFMDVYKMKVLLYMCSYS